MGDIRIGISGWRYAPWRGVFYPEDLPQHRELEFASRAFSSIELNGSFYSLQRPEYYARWYAQTPDDFVFSIKGARYITHMLRLRNVAAALGNFFASGLFNLRHKLGPILWQLPAAFRYDPERLEPFLALLPRDTGQALAHAQAHHDAKVFGRTSLAIDASRRLRHALEVRHPSFANESFVDLLRRYDVALVVADGAGKWPLLEEITSDFVYVRLHGDTELYVSGYSDAGLDHWARRILSWSRGSQPQNARRCSSQAPHRLRSRDVYCYFDNDAKVRAPFDAQQLVRKVAVASKRPQTA
jgi:uncharacterized protein YecE (DUF72 family)